MSELDNARDANDFATLDSFNVLQPKNSPLGVSSNYDLENVKTL